MASLNAELDPHERVKFLAIADGPWTIDNGLMTPTLKIKRSVLEARYQALVDDWHNRKKPIVWESDIPVPRESYVGVPRPEMPLRHSD